jgi:hypothetical protein
MKYKRMRLFAKAYKKISIAILNASDRKCWGEVEE